MLGLVKHVVKQALGMTGVENMIEVGQSAPSFAVKDHEGVERKLSDYAGKTVILWFYPKADTPG